MVGSIQIVEYALPQAPLRSSVDLSSDHCFPAIGNQGAQGSCTAWAATYYATGYVQAKLHNWNLAYQGNTDQLLSPAWTYNKCNYGIDQGSSIFANMDVSQTVGVCRLSKMPYDDTDYISWGNENAWRDAPPYRVNNTYTLPLGINSVKAIIAAGYPVTFALDANSYANFGTDDVLGSNAMGYSLNHANTVVGYDDSKVDHETGQVGAFKIVNSWGQWGPDYNGYYWITYQAFLGSWNFGGLNCVDCRYVNDHPKLLGIWNLNPQCDRSADVVLGIGPHSNPVETRTPWWSGSGHSMHQYPSFMCLDITEFMDTWAMNVTSFYLQIGDAATDGTITSFKVEYYENSYTLGSLSCISSESPDTPKNTPCYVTLDFFKISSVYIGSLNIHQTSWGISLATIPNTNVPINGEQLVFYADFYMDCPGSADDGYVDISFLDGTGSASAHTGTHLEDTLLISHLMVPGQQVTIKLHLKYTDWWGSQTIYEMTSYNSAATLPATPLNLNAYNPTRKSIDLSWTKGIGADKTKILRKIGGYPNSPNDGTQVYFGTDSSFNDTGLTSSTTYYYRAWSYWSTINNNSIGYSQDQEKTLANIPPMSNFTYSPFNPTTSDTIQFNETSTDLDGNIVAWSWKFGDGAITTLPNPSHKYTNSGVYMVTLNVTDDDGAQGTKSKSISVSNTPPIANFSYTPLNPKTSDTIQFTDISTDSDGTIISWFWRFGDGSTSTQQNPEHQYSDNVDYTVILNVTDNDGAKNTKTNSISVSNTPPIANFNFEPINPTSQETVFFNSSANDSDGSISNYTWDFGDGNTSYNQKPRNLYSDYGTYLITLNVTDNDGGTDTIQKTILVSINYPPNTPSKPSPTNGSSNVPLFANLSWTGGDPNWDTVTYDVYFGITSSPDKVTSNQSDTTYDPGTMNFTTTYYWKVVAWDAHGANATSPIWHFTSRTNHLPIAIPDNFSTNEDTTLSVSAPGLLGNDDDSDGDMLTAVKVSNTIHGSITLNSNGSFSYVPSANYYGIDTFTYKAYDGFVYSTVVNVTITINSVNDPPVFGASSPGNGSTVNLLGLTWSIPINDPEGDQLSWTIQCSNGQVNSGTGATNGTKLLLLSGLAYSTTYKIWVNATDPTGSNQFTRKWYTITPKSSDSGGGGGGGGGGGEAPPAGPQNKKPVANASAGEPYQGFVNSEILFDGSKSYDADGNITKWFWVFGDHTNGTGKTIRHVYSKLGTYDVTLTVTDNEGATDTNTTICVITQPNRPPTKPIITGPTNGTKNNMYTFTAVSSDLDNDTIKYRFDWGEPLSPSSEYLPNGTSFTVNHSWTAAGCYSIIVTVTDNQTVSSSKITVYINAIQIGNIGYLTDDNGDGIYDTFYNVTTSQNTIVGKSGSNYLIDSNGDSNWDYSFNTTNGLATYHLQKTPGFELVFVLCAIAIAIILWRKKRSV